MKSLSSRTPLVVALIVVLIWAAIPSRSISANNDSRTHLDKTEGLVSVGGHPSPVKAPAIINMGSLVFPDSSSYDVEIGGTTPGTEHDQINVTGTVTIGNSVALNTTSWNSYTPTDGAPYTIIENDGSDPVTGTFAGLAEGGNIPNFLGSGLYATITYSGGDGNDVVLTAKQDLPSFAKAFAPNPIASGDTSTLTFTIDNTDSISMATSLDFTDNLPSGMTVATTPNASTTCIGGTLTATAGTSTITYTGGNVNAGASCSVSVDIIASTSGYFHNTTGSLTSSLGNSGTAYDRLSVNELPGFSKSFSPSSISGDEISTLTFTINNKVNVVDATSLDFTDNLPSGMTVATTPNASTTCNGGTLTATAGTSTITYTGGTASAGTSCTISVDITSGSTGEHKNTTSDLTSSLGNSGAASDTLSVDADDPIIDSTDIVTIYTSGGPTTFTIEFSEDVYDPVGDTDADDVTNPANYILVEEGILTDFQTTACTTTDFTQDTQYSVDSVSYDNSTFTSTLTLNSGTPLPDGSYKLFVCGTTSVVDLVGNHLNSGTDAIYDFTVTPAPSSLPATGFRHGQVTQLAQQPAAKAYTDTAMTLEIPKLGVSMPIVGVPQSGASWDVTWLGNSAGYLYGSAFPTWAGNTVITGHVWDAYNQPGAFAEIKSLKYGDQVQIHAWGQTYTYEVRESKLVTTKNTSFVFQSEQYDWLTLVTCEFYNPFNGEYLFRRAVRAVLVSVK